MKTEYFYPGVGPTNHWRSEYEIMQKSFAKKLNKKFVNIDIS